jgi:hypothetical protein
MFWAVLILTVFTVAFGMAIYRIDKNVKSKYEKKFNPNEWRLPGHIELPSSVDSPMAPQPHIKPVAPVASVKVTYETKSSIYSGVQYTFYKALAAALKGEFTLLTNINATDVLVVVASNALATQVALNNLTAKQFAFVVCDKTQLTPLCVIDFGGAMDFQLKAACESAQLPLVSFNTQADYDAQILRAKILSVIAVKDSAVALSNESALDIVGEKLTNNLKENGISLELCPECSAVMLKRKAKNGDNAGKLFWICSSYPKCRGIRAIK